MIQCGRAPDEFVRYYAAMNVDIEKFIFEIQQRETIWNSDGTVYNNKYLKRKQCEELVDIFDNNNNILVEEDEERHYLFLVC